MREHHELSVSTDGHRDARACHLRQHRAIDDAHRCSLSTSRSVLGRCVHLPSKPASTSASLRRSSGLAPRRCHSSRTAQGGWVGEMKTSASLVSLTLSGSPRFWTPDPGPPDPRSGPPRDPLSGPPRTPTWDPENRPKMGGPGGPKNRPKMGVPGTPQIRGPAGGPRAGRPGGRAARGARTRIFAPGRPGRKMAIFGHFRPGPENGHFWPFSLYYSF